jgi:mannose-1-phosphate guanylyltransferase
VLPLMNRPFMEYTFAYLRKFGIEDIILTLNYLPDVIRSYLGDGSCYGVHLTYCHEEEPMGTAGAIKNSEKYLDGTFVALNGDIFTSLDLEEMLDLHYSKKAKTTLSLQWVDDPSAFGVVETDDSRKVLRFIEKPPRAEATTNWINAGIYILEPEVLKYVPENTHYMVERGLFPALLDAGEPVYGYQFSGYWLDMGTPGSYFSLNRDLLLKEAASPISHPSGENSVYYKVGGNVDSSTRFTGPVLIGSRCSIGKGVSVNGPVSIGDDCSIGDNAVINDAVIWDNVMVGAGASLEHCIVGNNVDIEKNRRVNDLVVTTSATAPLPDAVSK